MSRPALGGRRLMIAGSGAGRAHVLARLAVERGATVVSGSSESEPEAPGSEDTDEAALEARFDGMLAELGGLDVLVVVCSALSARPLLQTTRADWDAALSTALRAPFLFVRRALEEFLGEAAGGRIVLVAPAIQERAPGQAVIAAVQTALVALARSVTKEYGPRGIAANVILPLGAPTAESGALAEAVVFLAGDESSYVNGEALRIRLDRPGEPRAWR